MSKLYGRIDHMQNLPQTIETQHIEHQLQLHTIQSKSTEGEIQDCH